MKFFWLGVSSASLLLAGAIGSGAFGADYDFGGGGPTVAPPATVDQGVAAFDVTVDAETNTTYVAQVTGKTIICRRDRKDETADNKRKKKRGCVIALPGCHVFVAAAGTNPRELKSEADRNLAVRQRFRYLRSQIGLVAGFTVDVSSCGPFAEKHFIPPFIPPPPISP